MGSDAFPRLPEREAVQVGDAVRQLLRAPDEELRGSPIWPGDETAALAGFNLSGSNAVALADLQTALDGLRVPNAVWMDTTTLYRAHRLLDADPAAGRAVFDPLALLDLDLFVREFVLSDQIVSIARNEADPWTDLRQVNETIHEPVFLTLFGDVEDVPREVQGLLDHLLNQARRWMHDAIRPGARGQFAEWRETIATIFGVVPDEQIEGRITHGWGSDPAYITQLLLETSDEESAGRRWRITDATQQRIVGDATARGLVNADLAHALSLRYRAAAARLPTTAVYTTARAVTATDVLHAAMQELRDERLSALRRIHRSVVTSPVWAAILLSRAASTSQLWPELCAMREQAQRLRETRAALDTQLAEPDGEEAVLSDMLRALHAEHASLTQAIGGVGAPVALGLVASALMSGVGPFAYAFGLAATLGATLLSGDPAHLRARLLRRREVALTHLGATVTGLHQTLPNAARLWSLDDDVVTRQSEALHTMATLGWV
jgi:hypothetical protein